MCSALSLSGGILGKGAWRRSHRRRPAMGPQQFSSVWMLTAQAPSITTIVQHAFQADASAGCKPVLPLALRKINLLQALFPPLSPCLVAMSPLHVAEEQGRQHLCTKHRLQYRCPKFNSMFLRCALCRRLNVLHLLRASCPRGIAMFFCPLYGT